MTMNEMKYAAFSTNWQTRGAEIQLGKLAVGRFHKTITNTDIRAGPHIFKEGLLTIALFFR